MYQSLFISSTTERILVASSLKFFFFYWSIVDLQFCVILVTSRFGGIMNKSAINIIFLKKCLMQMNSS